MKSFLSSLLTCYTRLEYYDSYRTQRGICQTQSHSLSRWGHSSSSNGNQEKLQFVEFLSNYNLPLWRSLTVLTAIPRSLMNFSNTLSHYWQSSKNKFPVTLSQVVFKGFSPLSTFKVLGAI